MTDRAPLKIAGVYFVFGFIWILASDTLVLWVSTSAEQVARLQTVKGWIYVVLTTALVYGLMVIYSRQKQRAHREAIRAGEILSHSLEQKKLLVRELHHRVRNNLQTVLALLNLSDVSDSSGIIKRRVHAMAKTHELAMGFPDPTAIPAPEFIEQVVATSTYPGSHPLRVINEGRDTPDVHAHDSSVTLTVNQAVPLGMYLQEMIESTGESYNSPPPTPREIVVTTDDAAWSVEIREAPSRDSSRTETVIALCEAWAAQLGGALFFSETATVLQVSRRTTGIEQSNTDGK
ncbi:MAG: histidine kinase dimerization/phosphoacceptor domain -containing protein [Alkalispirochaeta sp.]